MSTSSVFLVTYDDGDFYTQHPETLAAFPTRIAAYEWALGYFASWVEARGLIYDVVIAEYVGDEVVSSVALDARVGVATSEHSLFCDFTDRSRFYRDLERQLSA